MNICQNCRLCVPVCPVYAATGREELAPPGKLLLLHRRDINPEDLAEIFASCAECGACSKACPAGIPLAREFSLAAAENRRCPGWPGRLAVFVSARPRLARLLHRALYPAQALLRRRGKLTGLAPLAARPAKAPGAARNDAPEPSGQENTGARRRSDDEYFDDRPAPVWGRKKAAKKAGAVREAREKTGPMAAKARALLFAGCLGTHFLPGAVETAQAALTRLGIEIVPHQLACCGQSALLGGLPKNARAMAQANLEMLGRLDFDYLFTLCPHCLATIRQKWPQWAPRELRSAAGQAAAKSADITAWLLERLEAEAARGVTEQLSTDQLSEENRHPGGKNGAGLVWHASCHGQDIGARLSKVLACRGIELRLPESRACCGARSPLRGEISSLARNSLLPAKPATVISDCPFCLLQLGKTFRRDGVGTAHALELLAPREKA